MNFRPSLKEATEIAAKDKSYKLIPVSCEILSDTRTPIEVLKILKNVSGHCYLLESVENTEKWGRYTFLGFDPTMEITCVDKVMKMGSITVKTDSPKDYLRQILSEHKSPKIDYLPPFTGGLVGYFSYDYLKYTEPSLNMDAADTEGFKDFDLMLFDKVIAFDNYRQKLILICNIETGESAEELEVNYNKAKLELKSLRDLILNGEAKAEKGGRLLEEPKPFFEKPEPCQRDP